MKPRTKSSERAANGVHVKGGALDKGGASFIGARVSVAKAYKMYVGGAFVRSESGRTFQKTARPGHAGADAETVNIPRASRKDARDAVLAAKGALDAWSSKTAYNRGQILYRLAEVMESRRGELAASLARASAPDPEREVDVAIDRAVYYAGFSDKFQALVATHNPVSGPHFGFTLAEPLGTVAIIAPERPALAGLVSTILPAIVAGSTCVVVASMHDPQTAVVLAECLATSDLPGGVVNILTGHAGEIAPHLAKHREVLGVDAWSDDAAIAATIEREGAGNVKRVKIHAGAASSRLLDPSDGQGLAFIERFLEMKTVWHPVGV